MSMPELPPPLENAEAYIQAIRDLNALIDAQPDKAGSLKRLRGFYMKQLEDLQNKKEAR